MIQSRVNIECVFVFVIEGPLTEKLQMLPRDLVLDGMPGVIDICFAIYDKSLTGILFKRELPLQSQA